MGDWKILTTAGTVVDIEATYNVKVQQAYGVGMPPMRNVITPYGLSDGGKFQRSIALPREFTLECIAPFTTSTTKANHHTAKKNLIELVKRDRQATEGPVTIRYTGATTDVQISAYYVSGLEGGEVTGNVEKFSMQMVAPDPFWRETSTGGTALTPGTAITANHAIRSTGAGVWANFGTGGGTATNYVNAIAEDADNIYIGGLFETWNGGTVNNVVRYDKVGGTYHPLNAGGTVGVGGTATASAGTVNTLAIDSGGTVYIGGDFGRAGDAAIKGITNYHETGDAFTDLGVAVLETFNAIVIDSTDDAWFGSNDNALKHWDGSTITTIDTANYCYSLSINASDVITLGGDWTSSRPGSVTSDHLAQYDINAGTWNTMASAAGIVGSLAAGSDGITVYAGARSSATAGAIQKWTGTGLETLGSINVLGGGTQTFIYGLAYDPDTNRLYAGGDFLSIDGDTGLNLVAYYDFATGGWNDIEVDLQSSISEMKAISYYSAGTSVVFGYENTGGAPSVTIPKSTAVSNTGTASATPTITMLGPGVVTKITNTTTGAKLEFSGLTLATGETMTINLTPGAKTISTTLRSSLMNLLTSDSNLSTFDLLPGSNSISLQTANTIGGTITWYDTHWSIYGAQ